MLGFFRTPALETYVNGVSRDVLIQQGRLLFVDDELIAVQPNSKAKHVITFSKGAIDIRGGGNQMGGRYTIEANGRLWCRRSNPPS